MMTEERRVCPCAKLSGVTPSQIHQVPLGFPVVGIHSFQLPSVSGRSFGSCASTGFFPCLRIKVAQKIASNIIDLHFNEDITDRLTILGWKTPADPALIWSVFTVSLFVCCLLPHDSQMELVQKGFRRGEMSY